MSVFNFIINEIFGQGAIFLALIACIGLILQKKSGTDIVRGTMMTAIGFFVLSTGTNIITGNSINGIATAFNTIMPDAQQSASVDIGATYGTQIGIVMVVAFAINILVAKYTKWKSVFLTGHMLYWFPFVFIAAGVDAGLTGGKLILLATIFTALYMIISPNLLRPLVKEVTGDDSFTIGHPTTCLSLLSGYLGKLFGNKSKSTEDLKFPKSLGFLREVSITGSIVIALTYIVMAIILKVNGYNPDEVWGYAGGSTGIFTFVFTHAIYFGVGVTIMLQGVRMLIAEIIPAFKGIADKFVPGAIPALDCPVIFGFAPNALILGFIVAMITSIITIILTAGMFPTVIIPLTFTCFFEIGCASIIGNATGGVRGAVIGSAVSGVIMVLLVGFGSYFFNNTIQEWMLVYGGQDFSLWGIIEGLVARLLMLF
ncbi:PTS ascorbate transporter subunit IIC [Turicibacter sanguinis]|uniref:Ascorbate-specific PTS system EIIC component n=1 Tax=Turicibacter sanguinis TaxID=154288 RepID=A0A6G2CD35_9FIRM|nr:PTS ascorbate transporter subunit IIC [Turicibacter sanguinis]MTK70018.1 PTS ascorbate transporter subunit IIC [Turicibacter sanguinis]MTK80897.1 PTS ascorbate transporter subunit IIC [Turicibacter sanguinis]MTK84043.1 PTS ascorbate transporter subunit IIC [Turicibacter sanguinis]MTK86810.1 PTS ascorbate transporter subunit IIC [Turicibacter sanguinis]MTK94828.1 PTS ascorbate transporter subunit IIC [Turicibacter sanguinis]